MFKYIDWYKESINKMRSDTVRLDLSPFYGERALFASSTDEVMILPYDFRTKYNHLGIYFNLNDYGEEELLNLYESIEALKKDLSSLKSDFDEFSYIKMKSLLEEEPNVNFQFLQMHSDKIDPVKLKLLEELTSQSKNIFRRMNSAKINTLQSEIYSEVVQWYQLKYKEIKMKLDTHDSPDERLQKILASNNIQNIFEKREELSNLIRECSHVLEKFSDEYTKTYEKYKIRKQKYVNNQERYISLIKRLAGPQFHQEKLEIDLKHVYEDNVMTMVQNAYMKVYLVELIDKVYSEAIIQANKNESKLTGNSVTNLKENQRIIEFQKSINKWKEQYNSKAEELKLNDEILDDYILKNGKTTKTFEEADKEKPGYYFKNFGEYEKTKEMYGLLGQTFDDNPERLRYVAIFEHDNWLEGCESSFNCAKHKNTSIEKTPEIINLDDHRNKSK